VLTILEIEMNPFQRHLFMHHALTPIIHPHTHPNKKQEY